MLIMQTFLYAFLATYLTWVFYLAVMHLAKVRNAGKLTKLNYVLGMPVLFFGYVLDFLVNVFVLSFIVLEIPRETTVTARLKRLHKTSTGYRLAVVHFFEEILDPFDPDGDHV